MNQNPKAGNTEGIGRASSERFWRTIRCEGVLRMLFRLAASASRPRLLPQAEAVLGQTLSSRSPSSLLKARQVRWHGDHVPESAKTIPLEFIRRNGEHVVVKAAPGQNILRVAQDNDIELEGACECSVACSTCHVVLEKDLYDRLPEPSDDEEDMLDMAFGLTETSRLGCQVIVDESMKGAKITLPKATRNFYVDGHRPTPH